MVVKINSKYKEDDFSDSNRLAFSLDVCVHRKHQMKQTRPTCLIPAHPSSRFTPAVSYKHSSHPQLHLNPGSFMMMIQILSATHLLICSTNMKLYSTPMKSHQYSSLIPLLTSKSTNFNSALNENISKHFCFKLMLEISILDLFILL